MHAKKIQKITKLFNPVEREYRRNKEEKKHFIVILQMRRRRKKKFLFAKEKKLTRLCPIVERLQIQNQV